MLLNTWVNSMSGPSALTASLSEPPKVKSLICRWLLGLVRDRWPAGSIRGAEIGVKKGELASLLLATDRDLRLFLVDRWAPAPPDSQYALNGDPAANASINEHEAWRREALARLNPYFGRVNIWCGESGDAADGWRASKAGPFDFVFLDGDHSYEGRVADLVAWYPLVKKGGIVAGGLLHSSFGGDCGRRALFDWMEQECIRSDVILGPAATWSFVK